MFVCWGVCLWAGQLAHSNVHLCVCDLSVCFRRSTSLLLPRPTSLWFLKNETRGVGKSLLRDRVKFESVVFEKLQCFFPLLACGSPSTYSLLFYFIRFSSQRRSTSACPTCQTSPTRRSPSRLTTLLETDGPHSLSSPPRRKLIPTSSSSPDLLSTRTDTGPCGSSHSSDASLEMRSSRRSLFARRSTLDTESELSDSTEPDRSRPPDSSSESK